MSTEVLFRLKCKGCSEVFDSPRKRKYCSSKCCSRNSRKRYVFTCIQCGIEKKTENKRRQFCSVRCYGDYKREKRRKHCEHCEKSFIPKHVKFNRFCSRSCAFAAKATGESSRLTPIQRCVKWIKARQKSYRRSVKPCDVCRLPLGKEALTTGKRRHNECFEMTKHVRHGGLSGFRTDLCGDCFKPISEGVGNKYRKKRCDKCRRINNRKWKTCNHRKRCRTHGTEYEYGITLRKLLVRDKMICQCCGKKVNINADHLSNEYPSIDHIVPISRGGDHKWSNVQLAHRGCNSKKGDGGGGQMRMW